MAALYYVGTLARNVLVEADDEADASPFRWPSAHSRVGVTSIIRLTR